ncbi:hypothetical protein LR002_00330 [Candidatus Gracilibacteria bacterium]|nr:hypothetical protein [Candidatus Gracilibacteria bacterium]
MIKYFKCEECGSILETLYSENLECLNCGGVVFENIGGENGEIPQWVKGCDTCDKKLTCEKIKK